ncbi:hypothetical protein NE237_011271 [Protea cynaroides]|uniref:Uncharacterized protein n=1 Tax=Protea cynaroides TaxID=273540 RepID=A0A9Q0GXM6_9MAGN|nr:hypothetical protein NE237_011271 [Protea cynaroides]
MQRERRDLQRRREGEGQKYHSRARKKRYADGVAEGEKRFPEEMGVAEGEKDLQRGLGFRFRGDSAFGLPDNPIESITVQSALKHVGWKIATQEEMTTLVVNNIRTFLL